MMDRSLSDKARAGRRAALSALNARLNAHRDVVSIFEVGCQNRVAVPEFRSVRNKAPEKPTLRLPTLVLTGAVAA